jgi:multidrug resistance efflux pump
VKRWIAGGVAVVAIGTAMALYSRRTPKVVQAPVPVAAAPLATDVVLPGRVTPRTIVSVNAPIEGTIEAFFVDAGAEVIAGQLLGKIRSSKGDSGVQQAQADLDAAQARVTQLNGELLSARLEASRSDADASRSRADLDRLQKAYERQKGLWAAGATARLVYEKSEKDYIDAKSAVDKLDTAAKAAASRLDELTREIDIARKVVDEKLAGIERSKQDVNVGELHAPADGVIVARHGQPGDPVDPSVKLIDMATEMTKLQATVQLTSALIKTGQTAIVHIADEDFQGVVQEVRQTDAVIYFETANPVKQIELAAQVKIKF